MIGIFKDLSNEEYHADKESISRSAIIEFKKSPYHYWSNYLNESRPERKSTKAMDFGNAFHTFILEPDKFEDQFCLEPPYEPYPPLVLLKDVGREAYDKFKAEKIRIENKNYVMQEKFNSEILELGKKPLSVIDFNQLKNMRDALQNYPKAWDLIQGAVYEQSYFWKDEGSGLIVKARPDILHSNMIVDLKTCADASPRAFQRAMVDGGYHIQGAMIREALRVLENREVSTVINIAIEKTYPYSIGIYIIDEYALEHGEAEFKAILIDLSNAIEYNTFESYPVQTISLPAWAV